jgi:hypothetical protein
LTAPAANLTVFAPTDAAFGTLVTQLGFSNASALVAALSPADLSKKPTYRQTSPECLQAASDVPGRICRGAAIASKAGTMIPATWKTFAQSSKYTALRSTWMSCVSTLPYLTSQNSSMNFSDNTDTHAETVLNRDDARVVLVREAGVPFQLPLGNTSGIDPIAEWLSLMEVVQMLCPVWPVRDRPLQGNHWRL